MKATEFSVLGPLMGGFGSQAFLGCVHRDDGIKPAVMVFLPDEIVDSAELFRRVWSETELGTFIDHVNVIGVMGVARLDEGYARVVEYADAESLRSVYRRATTLKKPIPPTIACAIVADACMGAHYAHELGVMETGEPMIHGGIRPETLQVSFKGMGKVTGYGATTIAEIARKSRGTDNVKDAYAAPEQSYGGRNATTIQTDVYALGCVMYEALTGKAPFAADNDLAEAMIRDELSRPQYEGVTDSMAMIVLKATRKKSSDRYQSALEMRMDILDKCEHATEIDIRHFMDGLFPPETVPRATRDQMLIAAREKPPASTGRLLTEIPPELDRRMKSRAAVPTDAEVEAAQGRVVEVTPVHQRAPPPAVRRSDDPTDDIHTAATRPPQTSDGLVDLTSDAEPITAPTAPHPIIGGRAREPDPAPHMRAEPTAVVRRDNIPEPGRRERPPSPAPAPSWQQAPTMPPYQSSAPPVVYRTSPAILVGFGAAGALAIALVGYVLLKEDPPPPQVIVQAPPPPPPPVVDTPPPPPVDDTPVASTSKKGTKGTKEPKDDPPPKQVATGPGKITVSATPASMVISINGNVVGTGSATFEGKAGTYKVVAKDKGLGAVSSRTVKLRAGQTVEVELAAEQGTLTFDQLPDGVDVFVDGKRVGKTPMPAVKLYAGPHKIVVKKGGADVALNATIVAGRELFITAQFGE